MVFGDIGKLTGRERALTGNFAETDKRRRVGLNLKKHREAAGLSKEELAFNCGLHRTYVSGVERGIRNPTVLVLQKIADALEIEAWLLLERRPAKS